MAIVSNKQIETFGQEGIMASKEKPDRVFW